SRNSLPKVSIAAGHLPVPWSGRLGDGGPSMVTVPSTLPVGPAYAGSLYGLSTYATFALSKPFENAAAAVSPDAEGAADAEADGAADALADGPPSGAAPVSGVVCEQAPSARMPTTVASLG